MEGESFYTKLAGVTHVNEDGTDRQGLLKLCRPGQRLNARREPENPHDADAIGIWSDHGMLGYLPAGDHKLATHLDRGGRATITVLEITGGPSFWERLFGRRGKFYGCNVYIEKHAPDWKAVEPWMNEDRGICDLLKAANKAEKKDPADAVAKYREAIDRIVALDAQGAQASAWRTARYPINRLSLTLERAKRFQEALEAIERWENAPDPVGIQDPDRTAVEKRKARLRQAGDK